MIDDNSSFGKDIICVDSFLGAWYISACEARSNDKGWVVFCVSNVKILE